MPHISNHSGLTFIRGIKFLDRLVCSLDLHLVDSLFWSYLPTHLCLKKAIVLNRTPFLLWCLPILWGKLLTRSSYVCSSSWWHIPFSQRLGIIFKVILACLTSTPTYRAWAFLIWIFPLNINCLVLYMNDFKPSLSKSELPDRLLWYFPPIYALVHVLLISFHNFVHIPCLFLPGSAYKNGA